MHFWRGVTVVITGWVCAVCADAEPLPRLPSRACRRLMKMVFQGGMFATCQLWSYFDDEELVGHELRLRVCAPQFVTSQPAGLRESGRLQLSYITSSPADTRFR